MVEYPGSGLFYRLVPGGDGKALEGPDHVQIVHLVPDHADPGIRVQARQGADSFGFADTRGGHVDGSAVIVEVKAVPVGLGEIVVKGLGIFGVKPRRNIEMMSPSCSTASLGYWGSPSGL